MEVTLPATNRPKSRHSLAHLPSSSSTASKDNATTDIGAIQRQALASQSEKRKLRGKSIGPGGLEALQESNGNKTKIAAQIRSILKPTVPLTPPKVIPSFEELRKRSTGKAKSPRNPTIDMLIDFSTPAPSAAIDATKVALSSQHDLQDPFSPIEKSRSPARNHNVPLDPIESQEAELQRQVQKQVILDQRAARRKSMANRRVSFAPEATLHTWSVMELAEDSTTSSASNSTRRQSAMTTHQSPAPPADAQIQQQQPSQTLVKESPAKKRRRDSTAPTPVADDSDEAFSSSPTGDVSVVESSPARSMNSEDDTSDDEGDTAMSLENTTGTVRSDGSGSTESSLDQRLRKASTQAGTRGIGYDEFGDDLPMDMATGTVTHAFQPWVKSNSNDPVNDLSAMQDQENINPFDAQFAAGRSRQDNEEEQTMEMTTAVGGIVAGSPGKRRKSVGGSRRKSQAARRRSSGGASNFDDETMEFTTVGGSILPSQQVENDDVANESIAVSDEDMTMEFTNVIGGVADVEEQVQRSLVEESETMDETVAVGGILTPIEERTEPISEVDETIAMDMTGPIETMLLQARQSLALESPSERRKSNLSVTSNTGSPSLPDNLRRSTRRESSISKVSTTPKMTPQQRLQSPSKRATPTKQLTPLPARAHTPNKTPTLSNVTHRSASPKRLFQAEIKARASPAPLSRSPVKISDGVFAIDEKTGQHAPSVVLHAPKPHQHLRRRSSGIGIDQDGMGSPRITEILSRRTSIGDGMPTFVSKGSDHRAIPFEDPHVIEAEMDAEREEESRRESGRFIMEQEADEPREENATLQLREMIESMTPRKESVKKLKGRKSLAVGAARGLLGKRPVELDIEEEDEESTPKRLKAVSREASPVKKVFLPKPASHTESLRTSVHRLSKAGLLAGTSTPILTQSPTKASAPSPERTGHFKEVPVADNLPRPSSFEDKLDNVLEAIDVTTAKLAAGQEPETKDEKVSLQSFLNMTNIHFIELSTTKRRHTIAPEDQRPSQEAADASLESCFVAAATTLPLLELYQHATRELKSYISSGRKLIRTIETETLSEQPALFREYIDARPDVKAIMDNQFRNGKAHARLQSKQGWYSWREQLVDGLRAGLENIEAGMTQDKVILSGQEKILSDNLPQLLAYHDRLETDVAAEESRVEELDSVDLEALLKARAELKVADEEHRKKTELLESLVMQKKEKVGALNAAEELKVELKDQISEADRVREECRGIPTREVLELEQRIKHLEKESGWCLVSAEQDPEDSDELGPAVTMLYKDVLRLFFYPAAFQERQARRRSTRRSKSTSGPTAPVSLTFNTTGGQPQQLSTEQRFFLQLIQSQVQSYSMMPRGSVSSQTLLQAVASGWDTAARVSEEIRLLNIAGIPNVSIQGDERLGAELKLMLPGQGRVDLAFELHATIDVDGMMVTSSSASATAIYDNIQNIMTPAKTRKVGTALGKEIEARELGSGSWHNAVLAFEQWVKVQTQKAELPEAKTPAVVSTTPTTSRTNPITHENSQSMPARSPLSNKRPAAIQKRAIPVPVSARDRTQIPKQRSTQQSTVATKESDKENVPPPNPMMSIEKHVESVVESIVEENVDEAAIDAAKPAMDPLMQEALMQTSTPIKRLGALRRSPVGGSGRGGLLF